MLMNLTSRNKEWMSEYLFLWMRSRTLCLPLQSIHSWEDANTTVNSVSWMLTRGSSAKAAAMKHLLHYSISSNSKIVQNQFKLVGGRDLMANWTKLFWILCCFHKYPNANVWPMSIKRFCGNTQYGDNAILHHNTCGMHDCSLQSYRTMPSYKDKVTKMTAGQQQRGSGRVPTTI